MLFLALCNLLSSSVLDCCVLIFQREKFSVSRILSVMSLAGFVIRLGESQN